MKCGAGGAISVRAGKGSVRAAAASAVNKRTQSGRAEIVLGCVYATVPDRESSREWESGAADSGREIASSTA